MTTYMYTPNGPHMWDGHQRHTLEVGLITAIALLVVAIAVMLMGVNGSTLGSSQQIFATPHMAPPMIRTTGPIWVSGTAGAGGVPHPFAGETTVLGAQSSNAKP